MARRITEKDHPEIVLQLQLYGWLYEQVIKEPPYKLGSPEKVIPL